MLVLSIYLTGQGDVFAAHGLSLDGELKYPEGFSILNMFQLRQ